MPVWSPSRPPTALLVTALVLVCGAACAPTSPTFRYEAIAGTPDALYVIGQTYYGDSPTDQWMLRCRDEDESVTCEEVAWTGRTPSRPDRERDLGMHSFEGAPQPLPAPTASPGQAEGPASTDLRDIDLRNTDLGNTDPRELASRCDAEEPQACTELGVRLEAGRGFERDLRMACNLFDRACDDGYELACERRHRHCSP